MLRANPRHVTVRGAIARAKVSLDAGDSKKAACWAGVAGKDGDPAGEYLVATYLRRGTGWPKDPEGALKWMLLSGKQGDYDAQKALAEMSARGEGTPQDPRQSMYRLQQASSTYMAQHRDEIMGTILRGFAGGESAPSTGQQYKCVQGRGYGSDNSIRTTCRWQ